MIRSNRGLWPAGLLVGGLLAASFGGLVSRSLRPGRLVGGRLGLDAWRRVLADDGFWDAMLFTLGVALVATVVAVVLAVPLGIAVRDAGPVGRSMMVALVPVPHLVVAATTVAWLGPGQLVDRIVDVPSALGGRSAAAVVLVYVVKEVPFLVLIVAAAIDSTTRGLEDAASTLGATRWHRWRFVLFPQLTKPDAFGALIVAAYAVGSTEIPLVLGPLRPEALTTHALTITRVRGPVARADAAVVLVLTSLLVATLVGIVMVLVHRPRKGSSQHRRGLSA